jgi:hypothetical protein
MSAGLAAAVGGALLAQPVKDGPLVGFSLVALISCAATLASLYLAGRLRPALGGELAPDALATPSDERGESIEFVRQRLAIDGPSAVNDSDYEEVLPSPAP